MSKNNEKIWKKYCERELEKVTPILKELGYELDSHQKHICGERYLMQAVTTESGRKLILLGRRVTDGKKVVIKVTSDRKGIRELEFEKKSRAALQEIKFAYQVFFSPKELLFTKQKGFAISIQEFISQERQFLDRALEDQFELALCAFKSQESAHATTYEHVRLSKKMFDSKSADEYVRMFKSFVVGIKKSLPEETEKTALIHAAEKFIKSNVKTIEQYSGFLTHTDFVPHNFRIVGSDIYLLDHSSIRFGNKYEGWARFVNFMALYNPELEQAFLDYVKNNRTPEESLSLKLMRIYRLGEIIYYYTNTLSKSEGDLLELNRARIDFWSEVLKAVLEDSTVSKEIIEEYKKHRDSLRSEEEKGRQKELH
jgi:hypothetical protein